MDKYMATNDQVKVSNLMTANLVNVNPLFTAEKIAKTMADHDISSVLVLEDKNPVGVVTERDILVKLAADGYSPQSRTARDLMTAPLISIHQDATLTESCMLMASNRIRRLMVHNEKGICGIITLTDIMNHLFKESLQRRDEQFFGIQAKEFRFRPMIAVNETESAQKAAFKMALHQVGAILVAGGNRQCIFTERDITRITAEGQRTVSVTVGSRATCDLIGVNPNQTVADIVSIMESHHIKRVMVMDNGTIVGVISIRDILEKLFTAHVREFNRKMISMLTQKEMALAGREADAKNGGLP